jgi:pimeloyl-ACP methyl ester carboxylesterase
MLLRGSRSGLLCVTLLLAASHEASGQPTDDLARRVHLGATLRPPSGPTPARVVRVDAGSALARAGLRDGDEVRAIDGQPVADPIEFDRRVAALRAGRPVRLQVTGAGGAREVTATLSALPREQLPGVEIQYTAIRNPAGFRQRAIVTRPAGSTVPRPAILFVPWLSCDSVESPGTPAPGIDELLHRLATESGWVLVRVDKPGVGDSEGVCADTDLETEIAGSRAALAWMHGHPWIDPRRIVVMGQSFSGAFLPVVAGDTRVAGYVVINSWSRTWYERLLEFERRQAEADRMAPAAVAERQRKLALFYALFLEGRQTPADVLAARPELASVWNDEPRHQYGRSARFHHQLHRIDAEAAWSTVDVPTLVMWGDADLVMHRVDHERLVAMVNRNRPGAATLVVVPGADHPLAVRDSQGTRVLPAVVMSSLGQFLARVHADTAPAGRPD